MKIPSFLSVVVRELSTDFFYRQSRGRAPFFVRRPSRYPSCPAIAATTPPEAPKAARFLLPPDDLLHYPSWKIKILRYSSGKGMRGQILSPSTARGEFIRVSPENQRMRFAER